MVDEPHRTYRICSLQPSRPKSWSQFRDCDAWPMEKAFINIYCMTKSINYGYDWERYYVDTTMNSLRYYSVSTRGLISSLGANQARMADRFIWKVQSKEMNHFFSISQNEFKQLQFRCIVAIWKRFPFFWRSPILSGLFMLPVRSSCWFWKGTESGIILCTQPGCM